MRHLPLLCALGLISACGSETPVESGGIDPSRVFRVDWTFPSPETNARALLGIQGSPVPVVPGDASLVEAYKGRHFQVVRLPQDDFCAYSLEGIFPDATQPAGDPDSYDFSGIDRLIEGVLAAGAEPLWQASYDLGSGGSCGSTDGRHAGRGIADPGKHAEVVAFVLRHFNQGTDWDPNGRTFGVRFVEFVNDPIGLGGYDPGKPEVYFQHFTTFAQGVKAAFPNGGDGQPTVFVLAPAHRIRSVGETVAPGGAGKKSFLLQFIDLVAGTGLPLDVLTVQLRFDSPYDQAVALRNIRDYMDKVGLVATPIWVTEVGLSEATEAIARKEEGPVFSSWVGAHLVASKIGWQETAERVFPHRGTRRFDGPSGARVLDSAFFDQSGAERRAVLPFTAFLIMRNQPILRGSGVSGDGAGMLAVRSRSENKMWLLVGNPGDGLSRDPRPFAATIENLPDEITSLGWKIAYVSAASPSVFQFSEEGVIEPKGGTALFTKDIPTPATVYVELTW